MGAILQLLCSVGSVIRTHKVCLIRNCVVCPFGKPMFVLLGNVTLSF